jgi:Zn-dependent protease
MRSWKLGTAFGIGIYIHWTFLLLIGFVLVRFWGMGGAELGVYGAGLFLAVFGCVVLHELGHALMARRYGIPTRDITLYPIGGVARLERMSERPWEEFWIAVAGPAVNVAIALLLSLPIGLGLDTPQLDLGSAQTGLHGSFLFDLRTTNIVLCLFNLLPAFPMDGGRVLRALLAIPFGRLTATQVAATLGAVFAFLFVLLGLRSDPWNPLLILVGAFAFLAGQQELAFVRQQEWNRRAPPLYALPADDEILDAVPVDTDSPFSGATWDARTRAWTLWHNGQPVRTFWTG